MSTQGLRWLNGFLNTLRMYSWKTLLFSSAARLGDLKSRWGAPFRLTSVLRKAARLAAARSVRSDFKVASCQLACLPNDGRRSPNRPRSKRRRGSRHGDSSTSNNRRVPTHRSKASRGDLQAGRYLDLRWCGFSVLSRVADQGPRMPNPTRKLVKLRQ